MEPGSNIFVFSCSTLNIAMHKAGTQPIFVEMKEKELLYTSVHSMNISGDSKKYFSERYWGNDPLGHRQLSSGNF